MKIKLNKKCRKKLKKKISRVIKEMLIQHGNLKIKEYGIS